MRRPPLTQPLLAAAGVSAVLVLLPGVAQAAPTPAVPTPPGPMGDVFSQGGGALNPNENPLTSTTSSSTTTGTSSSSSVPQLPPPPSLPGASPECQAHVQADLQAAIQDLPATIQSIVDTIVGQLGSGAPPPPPLSITDPRSGQTVILQFLGNGQPPKFSSPNPADLPTVKDLQKLADDLQKYCSPKPPTASGQTPAGHSSAPVAAQAAVPTSAVPAPAPQAQQPVSYPGYAPTGGSGPAPVSVPLAVLGGALVLAGGAGSVGYGVHRRAARRRG